MWRTYRKVGDEDNNRKEKELTLGRKDDG